MSFASQGASLGVGLVALGVGASIASKAIDSSNHPRRRKKKRVNRKRYSNSTKKAYRGSKHKSQHKTTHREKRPKSVLDY